MAITEPVKANFLMVKVSEGVWDVVIMAESAVLRAFEETYGAHYIEDSVFNDQPVAIVPDFPNQHHAESWKEYWIIAFNDPENACKTCNTVNELFSRIETGRQTEKSQNK
jgi:hypothetical protein